MTGSSQTARNANPRADAPDISTVRSNLGKTQTRRKLAIGVAALFVVPLLLLARPIWTVGSWQSEIISSVGIVLVFISILGRSWCTLYIGGRKIRELVKSGPYSMTRNPLYVFSFIGAAGVGAQTGSMVWTLILPLLTYAIFVPVIRREEAGLYAVHGATFDDYCQSVPRIVPKLSRFRNVDELEINPRHWQRTVADGLVILACALLLKAASELLTGRDTAAIFQIP